MSGCGWLTRRGTEHMVIHAFQQACGEFGIPGHLNGECPSPDCDCEALGDQVEARAIEIIEQELGRPLPAEVPS